jgi:hypothetical protein
MLACIFSDSHHLASGIQVRVGHDNSLAGSAWFLDKITVLDPATGQLLEFPCNRWLAKVCK